MTKAEQDQYFAWCNSAPTVPFEHAKWDRYDNHAIKEATAARGFITNGDLLCCGHSVNQMRGIAFTPLADDPKHCAHCDLHKDNHGYYGECSKAESRYTGNEDAPESIIPGFADGLRAAVNENRRLAGLEPQK